MGGGRRQFFMYSFLTKRPFPFHLKLSIHFLPCTPPTTTFSPFNLDLDFVYCQEAVGVPACDFARSAKPLCKKFKGGKKTLKERGENWHSFVVVCCYCKYEHIYSGYLNVEKKNLICATHLAWGYPTVYDALMSLWRETSQLKRENELHDDAHSTLYFNRIFQWYNTTPLGKQEWHGRWRSPLRAPVSHFERGRTQSSLQSSAAPRSCDDTVMNRCALQYCWRTT